jgi:Tfp pilus assembly protein PilV
VRRPGLTLIEVIVSAAILSLVMLTVLALLATVGRASRKAEYRAKAAALSENIVERMRHQPLAALETGPPIEIAVDPQSWDLPNVTAQALVTEVPGFDGRLKEVALTVEWTEFGRPNRWTEVIRLSALRH